MPTLNVFCLHVLSFFVLERSCKGKKFKNLREFATGKLGKDCEPNM